MALPLPSVIPNAGYGGGVVNAMQAMGNLQNTMSENQIKGVEAQYAPLTTLSNAFSKAAYGSLVGPQFIAKLMSDPTFLANVPGTDEQKRQWMATVLNKGLQVTPGAGNAMATTPASSSATQQPAQQPVPQSATQQPDNGSPQPQPLTSGARDVLGLNDEVWKAQNAWMKSPDGYAQAQRDGYFKPPQGQQLLDWYHKQQAAAQPVQGANAVAADNARQPTIAESSGNFQGTIAEGKRLGELRANEINDLGKEYKQDVEASAPLKHLMDISQSPTFMNMRNSIPGFQDVQLNTLKNFTGTQAQKDAIGDFIVSAKSSVANTVNGFKGRTMAKEFDFANMMKISDNDNIDVIIGKLKALNTFKQATMQRNEVARNLMEKNHMNVGDAYENANKKVDMDAIREGISKQLQHPISITNSRTGEQKFISPKEYNALLLRKEQKEKQNKQNQGK